jgi:hypothetical protein
MAVVNEGTGAGLRGNVIQRIQTTGNNTRMTMSNSTLPVNYTKTIWLNVATLTGLQYVFTIDAAGVLGNHSIYSIGSNGIWSVSNSFGNNASAGNTTSDLSAVTINT